MMSTHTTTMAEYETQHIVVQTLLARQKLSAAQYKSVFKKACEITGCESRALRWLRES